jgi:hypothetical protein
MFLFILIPVRFGDVTMCNNRDVFVLEFRMPCDVEFRHSDVRTSFGVNGDTREIRVFDVTRVSA